MPLTPELAEQYERAAVALENHLGTGKLGNVGAKAFSVVHQLNLSRDEIDNRAARLLRECIAKGEPLP